MAIITVTELEAAINYWRQRSPATGEEARLCPEAAALAAPYAAMIIEGVKEIDITRMPPAARQALDAAQSSARTT